MPAIGASVPRKLVAVYTVGAGIAGIAGALLAQTTQFVGIDTLGFPRSAELMIMLVLGGTGYLYGALIGAAVFMLLQDYLSNLNPVYWQFWLGLLLVVIVLFARGGLMGGLIGAAGGRLSARAQTEDRGVGDTVGLGKTFGGFKANAERQPDVFAPGRAARAHRAQWRGQDDVHQPADGCPAADMPARSISATRTSRRCRSTRASSAA